MEEPIETFGASIPKLAGDQLKVREELFGDSPKSIEHLQVINSNTA